MEANSATVSRPMLRLARYLKAYRNKLLGASVSSILNKILDLMPPLLVGWAVDAAYKRPPGWIQDFTGTTDPWNLIIIIGVSAFVIFGLESLFEWRFQLGFMNLAQKVQHDLRLDAYRHLQSREMAYFEENRTGNLMAMLNDDVNQLERFLNDSFNQILQIITLLIFATIVLFGISWELTLLGVIPIPLILLASLVYQRRISPRYKRIREAVGKLSSRLENNISGILVVKSFAAEEYESERVEEASDEYQQANRSAIKLLAAYIPVIRLFIALGFACVLLLGGYWALNDLNGFTAGHLTTFAMMIQRLLWPITRLGKVFDDYERAKASSRRIFGMLDTPNQMKIATEPITSNITGNIELQDVTFNYNNNVPVLQGVNLSVEAGHNIGIAGTTGAGKTTLIKLLLRLYDASGGKVLIDGQDIRDFDLQYLRSKIALVSQDVYLFHGSIGENIAYGIPTASKDQIQDAAIKAELNDFVQQLPNGYDTIVGERGIKLSGGQRQRLSIARAILKNAPILILDEATSSVDTETERSIQKNLDKLAEGKTAIIIAHRLSTIRHADQILVLDAGTVVEQGNHEELLAHGGIYSDLWNIQVGGGYAAI